MDPATSKNQQFRSVREAVWECELIGGSAKLVALRLVEYWPRIFPSLATIGRFTGLSERCIRDALRELERKKIIATRRQQGLSSTYQFIGVSIPALGREEDDDPQSEGGEGGEGRNSPHRTPPGQPRQIVPEGGAPSAGPPRQMVPPKPSRLSLLDKGRRERPSAPPPPPQGLWRNLDGWEMSSALRAEAIAAGVPAHRIDARVAKLRVIYIGGKNGVRDRDGYVRGCFEQWARWEKENAAKDATRNGLTARNYYWGAGSWEVSRKMRAYASKFDLDVDSMAQDFVDSGACDKAGNAEQADRVFIKRLVEAARAKGHEPESSKPAEPERRKRGAA